MDTKHTPGPWALGAGYGMHGVRVDGDGGNLSVCGVPHVERDTHDKDGRKTGTEPLDRGWADARLISAAPELLQVALMIADGEYNDCDVLRAAESAIAKATGQ